LFLYLLSERIVLVNSPVH